MIVQHQLERFFLERRLELLRRLDDLAEEAYNDEDNVISEDHYKVKLLQKSFEDVIDPYSLETVLKHIYEPKLYGGPSKKKISKKN